MNEQPEGVGISHTLLIFGVKFTLFKTQKGYKGNFSYPDGKSAFILPIFQGYSFKQALGRLMYKAVYSGLISIEDYNNFIGMSWKTPLDLQVWGPRKRILEIDGKHYFISTRIK